MVKRTNPDGSRTMYISGIYEERYTAGGALIDTTKYYPALGRTIAMRTETSSSEGPLTYLLADHLGSTVGLVDTSGNLVANSKTAYWPYGATRSGAITQTDKLYTGQQQEPGDALGLYNYKARFYSTVTGRMTSADTITLDGLNRYAYAGNGPMTHTDPGGHCFVWGSADLTNDCSWGTVKSFLDCGFEAACQGFEDAGVTRDDAVRLSRWAFQQQSFYDKVWLYSAEHRDDVARIGAFVPELNGLSEPLVFGEAALGLAGSGREGNEQTGGVALHARYPGEVARITGFSLFVTYLSVHVLPSFELVDPQAGFLLHEWYLANSTLPWQAAPRFDIPFSLFDRANYELQVKFDVGSTEFLGGDVLFYVSSSNESGRIWVWQGCSGRAWWSC